MLERLRIGPAGPTLPMDPGPILNGGMSLMLYLKMGDCEDLFTYDRKLITLVKKKKTEILCSVWLEKLITLNVYDIRLF